MKITFKLVETHENYEEYTIEQLPDNWDELNRRDKYSYIGEHGDFIDSYSECVEIVDVLEIDEEEREEND